MCHGVCKHSRRAPAPRHSSSSGTWKASCSCTEACPALTTTLTPPEACRLDRGSCCRREREKWQRGDSQARMARPRHACALLLHCWHACTQHHTAPPCLPTRLPTCWTASGCSAAGWRRRHASAGGPGGRSVGSATNVCSFSSVVQAAAGVSLGWEGEETLSVNQAGREVSLQPMDAAPKAAAASCVLSTHPTAEAWCAPPGRWSTAACGRGRRAPPRRHAGT